MAGKVYTAFDLDIADKVAHICLNRPDKHNSMTLEFWQELSDVLLDISNNALARAIVISSVGKNFSSGLDLSVFDSFGNTSGSEEKGRQGEALVQNLKQFQQVFTLLEQIRLPVLAAVQGGCIGGGLDMICACDSRYCTSDAWFTVMETRIAMTADVGTLQRIQHVLPSGIARELVYTGRKMSATEADNFGLVNQVYDSSEQMLADVMDIARNIASNSPLSVYGCKKMLNYAREHTVEESLDYQAIWQAGMFHQKDMEEAFKARSEGRAPEFDELEKITSAFRK
jgi:enoyl-CoA hydratase